MIKYKVDDNYYNNEDKMIFYLKDGCPFCEEAKSIIKELKNKQTDIYVINFSSENISRNIMLEKINKFGKGVPLLVCYFKGKKYSLKIGNVEKSKLIELFSFYK